jgi:hypothetical protein
MAEEEVSIRDIVSRFIFLFLRSPSSSHLSPAPAQLALAALHSSFLRFIAASPSGELQFVLSDLRGLVNQDEFDLQAELPALVAE